MIWNFYHVTPLRVQCTTQSYLYLMVWHIPSVMKGEKLVDCVVLCAVFFVNACVISCLFVCLSVCMYVILLMSVCLSVCLYVCNIVNV